MERPHHFILRDPGIVHFSVDIETLATTNNAAITEIGAVIIGPVPELQESFYAQCVDLHGEVDESTVKWRNSKGHIWIPRTPDTAIACFGIQTILPEFFNWIRTHSTAKGLRCKLWCKGTDFDKVILSNCAKYRCNNLDLPWRYNDFHDMRTVLQLFPGFKVSEDQIKHTAYDDAVLQADQIIKAADWLEELSHARIQLANERIGKAP